MRIERNFEMPVTARSRAGKYPLEDLNVGDAIVLPPHEVTKWKAASLSAVGRNFAKRNGTSHKFTVRKMEDGSIGIWRTE